MDHGGGDETPLFSRPGSMCLPMSNAPVERWLPPRLASHLLRWHHTVRPWCLPTWARPVVEWQLDVFLFRVCFHSTSGNGHSSFFLDHTQQYMQNANEAQSAFKLAFAEPLPPQRKTSPPQDFLSPPECKVPPPYWKPCKRAFQGKCRKVCSS